MTQRFPSLSCSVEPLGEGGFQNPRKSLKLNRNILKFGEGGGGGETNKHSEGGIWILSETRQNYLVKVTG